LERVPRQGDVEGGPVTEGVFLDDDLLHIPSALVAHTGWHWMLERGSVLAQFQRPTFGAAFLRTTTLGESARSTAVMPRPARIGVPMVSK
jgi:hypothetical protein